MHGDVKLLSYSITIERAELMHLGAHRMGLKGEVRQRLPEVVKRELRVFEVGSLDVTVSKVRHENRCIRGPD